MKSLRKSLSLVVNPTLDIHGDLGCLRDSVLCIPIISSIPLSQKVFDAMPWGSKSSFKREINTIAAWNAGNLGVKIALTKSYFEPSGSLDTCKGYYCFPVIR